MSGFDFFNNPYPADNEPGQGKIIASLLTGLFVALFLLIFQPFGLHASFTGKTLFIAGYGLITAASMMMVYFIIPKINPNYFDNDNWTTGKEILRIIILIFIIATGNFLYTTSAGFYNFDFITFLLFAGITLVVGIFPVTAFVLLNRFRLINQHLKMAENLNYKIESNKERTTDNEPAEIVLSDEEQKNSIKLKLKNLLFIAAADNYVEIYFLYHDQYHRHLLRNTMKNIEKMVDGNNALFRCHRSYIINIYNIENITGNSQGYAVTFHQVKTVVPVSRSKVKDFKKLIENQF